MKFLYNRGARQNKDFYHFNKHEYIDFLNLTNKSESIYPRPDLHRTTNGAKFLLITLECFRNILEHLTTPRRYVVQNHVDTIDRLSILYQDYCRNNQMTNNTLDASDALGIFDAPRVYNIPTPDLSTTINIHTDSSINHILEDAAPQSIYISETTSATECVYNDLLRAPIFNSWHGLSAQDIEMIMNYGCS